ncbi:NCS1 nucleoside transporter family protein [Gloeophyllum trabeum ATCC 11539]|uniref:NCS1 nucleoside transporter family protein n=1 Tax=Gloeophyllum trabeum (strain ATCC 11539 / FP-39264 / Madison 617) TaxID=670483 RepID=S7RJ38_GLOTA|nr:NCS1 nucleoside transporter family protein [Gloeophyllum trabeum ATCC 11539]EPQ54370.1 NCS1 nucleoside transporter family protein [Gloeophyllum trabeum ATCC 11539]
MGLAEWLQVPIDDNAAYKNDVWTNRDLIPIPEDRRTWDILGYLGYWVVGGACISAWTTGSTMLSYGLNAQEAIGAVVVGSVVTGLLAVSCGWMGERHKIGFTVSSRFIWGMRGSYFPVLCRIFTACCWTGIQGYWGGQATRVLIGAIIPGFAHMKNTLPESAGITTNDLIGMLIWYAVFALTISIPPERMQRPFFLTFVLFAGTAFGMLAWAVAQTGGSAGPLFHTRSAAPQGRGWAFMFGVTSLLGSWGAGTLGQSDWTRYARRPRAPTLSQVLAAPLTITLTALIGIVVTSCGQAVFGEVIWNPIYMLAAIQEHYGSSPRARAGVFFASLGLVASQLAINTVLNSVSTGMDMAGLAPRYINIRRGGYVLCVVGLAINPWRLVGTANKFLTVLSGFGVFLAPMTGILLAEYLVVRKQKLRMSHLYRGDSGSIYWYWHGFNPRVVVPWLMGVWPLMPGFVAGVNGARVAAGWTRLFNLTFAVGLAVSFVCTLLVDWAFPPPHLGEEDEYHPFVEEQEEGEEKKGVEVEEIVV